MTPTFVVAMEALVRYPWPGNVRELENVIERIVVLSRTKMVMPQELPSTIRESMNALLLRGMEYVGRVAVAKLSMREREHLCTIRPYGDVLLLQTLHWADELRDAGEVAAD